MNQFGHTFRVTVWGESHGPQIGLCIDGVRPGIALTAEDFEADLARRRAGAAGTTQRHEADRPELLSGLYRGITTGAPLTIAFGNGDARPEDYAATESHFRPSHADRTAAVKYAGCNDPRGGGHFSGRMTLALVAAGVVAKRHLPEGITFSTRVAAIGGCDDPTRFDEILQAAAAAGDSVGGEIECRIGGVAAGIGEPFFDSVESVVSHLVFAIPGVRGIEFGTGFAAAAMRGSEHNDPILDDRGTTATNHAGGINGGIANGNEIRFRVAVKPTPSIAREQMTYNGATGRVEPLSIRGRHDGCIALRAAVVVEAAAAIALADLYGEVQR